eukprot:TRINITY_DN1761_c0_g1_i6.p1 TRINITY_DN1761_c0_g1~~TRINITY_DN1761_c0_g1_i6.p1  ORF type:complete len:755 (+),score=172.91 TRINITY_DN1761_c0_g1_i6:38-2302(+)
MNDARSMQYSERSLVESGLELDIGRKEVLGAFKRTLKQSHTPEPANKENLGEEWSVPPFREDFAYQYDYENGSGTVNSPNKDQWHLESMCESAIPKATVSKSFLEDTIHDITNSPKVNVKDFHTHQNMFYQGQHVQPIPFPQPPTGIPPPEEIENDSEDEGIEDYKVGGYHPVHIGEVILNRYVIIQKLGWGHFSTVWLAKDFKYDTFVALKVQKSSPHYLEAAYDEVEILQRVARNASDPRWIETLKEYYKEEEKKEFTRDDSHVVQLLNSFIYKGPYGNHFCMVFEILGVNLLEVIKRYNYKGVPMHLCRILCKQILIGLDYLHRFCGVIHTDLKPENVLLCLTKEEIREIYVNGMLQRGKEYAERIKTYQRRYGIIVPEEKELEKKEVHVPEEESEEEEQPKSEVGDVKNLTKNQRKKLKKKLRKAKKKAFLAEPERAAITPTPTATQTATEKKICPEATEKESWRGRKIDENVRVKIADLGNACWLHHHFSPEIQTRQYRSPEVIVGVHYGPSADIWSFACMMFEMLTGDFLFDPRKGPNFGKDDDHLAQVVELTKKFPKKFARGGTNARKFFDRNGDLRRIRSFHFWSLKEVLVEKYKFKSEEAVGFASFLMPMLEVFPNLRISAQEALQSMWLRMPQILEVRMTAQEIEAYMQEKNERLSEALLEPSHLGIEGDENDADCEDISDQDESGEDEHREQALDEYKKSILDRSFYHGGYVGYGEGIYMDQLDQGTNWQFNELNAPGGKTNN